MVGRDAVEQRVVVAAGGAQPGALLVGQLGVERLADRAGGAAGLLGEPLDERVLAGGRPALDLAERELGLELAAERERGVGDADGGVVEQALVDVADLLDVERLVGEQHARAALLERLQRVEQVEHRAVVDRQRVRPPARASRCRAARPSRNG